MLGGNLGSLLYGDVSVMPNSGQLVALAEAKYVSTSLNRPHLATSMKMILVLRE